MKKIFTFLLLIGFAYFSIGQTIVSTNPMNKKAILEEFTGIHCGYCPDGHAIAHSILEELPNQAFAIAVHAGSFANPSAGEPDFRTEFGEELANQSGLTGYPSGTVNRHIFPGINTTAMGRGEWRGACLDIIEEPSPVNIGIVTTYDESTRNLQIDVELYYTANSNANSNKLNIALTQDNIYGPQSGGNAGNNYSHMHMLRHLITGQWGEDINNTNEGDFITKSYNYTIPEDYNGVEAIAEDMNVVVFVSEGNQEIYTGDQVPVINGSNLYIGSLSSSIPIINLDNNENNEIIFNANSNIQGESAFNFEIEKENFPSDWSVAFEINGNQFDETGSANLNYNEDTEIKVIVTPGETSAIPSLKLKIKSAENINAPEKVAVVKVISNINAVVVNGTGGPESTQFENVYLDGLRDSGTTKVAVINADDMVEINNYDAHGNIGVFWINISWTFPALTDEQANAITDLLNKNCNMSIAGQDIGWDIMSGHADAHGTEITQNLYTNIFNAEFVDDGSSLNNTLSPFNDEIFEEVSTTQIVDVFGGNMYPDQINPINEAKAAFMYNNDENKVAAVYSNFMNSFNTMYFGIGLEMIEDVAVRNTIIGIAQNFLASGGINVEEASEELFSGNCYPNPANTYTLIPIKEKIEGSIILYNIKGEQVMEVPADVVGVKRIDISHLPQGSYFYQIVTQDKNSKMKQLIISR